MAATDLAQIHLPDDVVDVIRARDTVEWIDGHIIHVDRRWWTTELNEHGLEGSLLADKISRGDIFAIADAALDDPAAALSLLWNALAWGTGTRHRNNKARIASVAFDPGTAGALLHRAAQLSRADPAAAYELLRPRNTSGIKHLGPAFFTKYLYFAGAGATDHRCCILDQFVALALQQTCGWTSLPHNKAWLTSAYARYALLLDRWTVEYGLSRRDMIERWLFDHGKSLSRAGRLHTSIAYVLRPP